MDKDVSAIIEGYGGSIDKHMGENVMAVFDPPQDFLEQIAGHGDFCHLVCDTPTLR